MLNHARLVLVPLLPLAFAALEARAQDAGVTDADAGVAPADASPVDADAGVADADAGTTDAGALPATSAPTSTAPVTAHNEPTTVDGWTVVSVVGDRRLPDGRATRERCGYERDVVVSKMMDDPSYKPPAAAAPLARDPKAPAPKPAPPAPVPQKEVTTKGVLNVPCVIDPKSTTGGLIAGTPALKLPPEFGPKKPTTETTSLAQAAEPPTCKEGEKPKKKADLKPGEVACKEKKGPRPCAEGEKPIPKEELKAGQEACKEHADDRGVPFLKGELSHMGDVQITNVRSSVGVGLGVATIDNVYYAQLRPDVNFHYGPFGIGLGTPLRFEVADLNGIELNDPETTTHVFDELGRFRTEDWDQVEDFFRPLRYVTWGHKEETLYIDVNRVHAITIGHGQLMRRYTGNLDIDEDNLFAEVDAYADFGGVELMTGPFPIPRLAGGLLFVKPLGLFMDNIYADSWSVGASYMTDLNAPTTLQSQTNPADGRTQLAIDQRNQFLWRGRDNPIGDVVQGVGGDSEVKVLKLDFLDIKVYGDYSHLFFPADSSGAENWQAFNGQGIAAGGLFRFSFGETPVRDIEEETEDVQKGRAKREMKAGHAVRVRLEARTFSPQYLPSYWNTLYEVDRLQFGDANNADRAELPTKIGFLAARADEPWRMGFYSEASYAWVDALAVTLAYEDAYPLGDAKLPVGARNLALHAETQGLGFLQLFATYHFRNFEDLNGIFSFNTDHEIFFFGGRLQILPFLFLNAGAQRAFRVGLTEDDTTTPDKDGLRYTSVGLENEWAGTFDVEIGWQF